LAAYANKAAKIDIEVGKTNGEVLVVPVAAVATSQDGSTRVQVQRKDGSVQDVAVRLGLTANGLVEVSGTGLAAGDRVVVGSK
jgi:multidrug efflux pump subunit AcrA (membrane-fusion protein)